MQETRFTNWPCFPQDEIDAVVDTLKSGRVNYLTGEQGRMFEQEFSEHCATRHAVALANGTVALELALASLGIGAGDEVIVTPRSFIASASCIVLRGGIPVFAEVDRNSQNITADSIESVITPRTKAIITVHLAGWPCDMDPIMQLAGHHDLHVIEDCAQAHGARYKGRPVGSFGHAAAFSFCQDKIITTGGEGGMLVTNDTTLWEMAWSYKDHGKNHAAVYGQHKGTGFRWLHERFGTNWRMTEMQSAIGRMQLGKLAEWHGRRSNNAGLLSRHFAQIPALRVTLPPDEIDHAYYKYYAFIRPELLKPEWTRDRIVEGINSHGIPCFSGSCSEMYLEKAFESIDSKPRSRLPVARELGETSLMFLVHPTQGSAEMEEICSVVEQVFKTAMK